MSRPTRKCLSAGVFLHASSGSLLRRYVHGSGVDEPLIWYEGSTISAASRRYQHTDHQGSITAVTDSAGNALSINTYDPYGVPGAGNISRFQYTGQITVPELGLYYYKARIYNQNLGRFMQTDPIGYKDDLDLYTYVGNDPMDRTDPSGKSWDDVRNVLFGTFEVVGGGLGLATGSTGLAASGILEVGTVGAATPVSVPLAVGSTGLIVTSMAVANDGVARMKEGLENLVIEARGNTGGRQGQGERNRAARPDGTPTPEKHKNEAKGYRTDPQTGKKIPLPPPPRPKPDEPERVPKKKSVAKPEVE